MVHLSVRKNDGKLLQAVGDAAVGEFMGKVFSIVSGASHSAKHLQKTKHCKNRRRDLQDSLDVRFQTWELIYLYQKFNFIAISGWFHPHFRHWTSDLRLRGRNGWRLQEDNREMG